MLPVRSISFLGGRSGFAGNRSYRKIPANGALRWSPRVGPGSTVTHWLCSLRFSCRNHARRHFCGHRKIVPRGGHGAQWELARAALPPLFCKNLLPCTTTCSGDDWSSDRRARWRRTRPGAPPSSPIAPPIRTARLPHRSGQLGPDLLPRNRLHGAAITLFQRLLVSRAQASSTSGSGGGSGLAMSRPASVARSLADAQRRPGRLVQVPLHIDRNSTGLAIEPSVWAGRGARHTLAKNRV